MNTALIAGVIARGTSVRRKQTSDHPSVVNAGRKTDQRGRGRTVERRRSLRESHWFNVS